MDNTELINRMVDKSIEAFIMGLEIYNKPNKTGKDYYY